MRLLEMIADPPGREAAFEPLLDQLAEIFDPDEGPWRPRLDGRERGWYERCETKRLAIARAAAQNLDGVREHADLVLSAIVHDIERSGNRQLIQVALRALGARAVLEALIGYVESGDAAERTGVTMAMYWARPVMAYDLREVREHRAEIEAADRELVEVRGRARQACLRAFLATDDAAERVELSLCFTLDPGDYPAGWDAALRRAVEVALADRDRFGRLLRTLSPE
ncbi:hypothetical protein KDL01_39665 [Actinospica durhamensis]|uniref:Uncharacterized protein n=1 Tax=Actinospica durhamensis TaxID=1508375 RepID=A0A941IS19_9ACTN|nr:hypothetical protein [Actinospica durhamensis]MBR7839445.1 hypothetical protein [Actinospica durhamensis]